MQEAYAAGYAGARARARTAPAPALTPGYAQLEPSAALLELRHRLAPTEGAAYRGKARLLARASAQIEPKLAVRAWPEGVHTALAFPHHSESAFYGAFYVGAQGA